MTSPELCPCGSGSTAAACCVPYHRGETKPPTAEALMRARYSAYVLNQVDYILKTHDPDIEDRGDRKEIESWSTQAKWLGLEIVSTEAGGAGDETGVVEFIARYKMKGQSLAHHERSRFRKIDGAWFYQDGEMVKPGTVQRTEPKLGRNDPCHCGSGKKYKRCHGAS